MTIIIRPLQQTDVHFIGKTEQPHFPAWHDSSLNCSTWTDAGGCKCEVEP